MGRGHDDEENDERTGSFYSATYKYRQVAGP